RRYSAVLCLGAVIRGDTPHFDYVANESARGIADISAQLGVPVIYGIMTADNLEQAIERAGTRMGNKGAEAAFAGIEVANLLARIDSALGGPDKVE
ncbi:MAG TPA: 6,7-dimethyl-8-ribityllumazine synthase, partial [Armatimonadota bacterium]|nr:6,7-dimethyl-8-ribityllumazine synthase [Armatimonadota bacterium]